MKHPDKCTKILGSINVKYSYNGKDIYPSVEILHSVFQHLGGINCNEFFTDYVKCAEAWIIGTEYLNDFYKGLIPIQKPSGAPFSYGHLVCLGSPVIFPEDGEPNVVPFANSIDEGIEILKSRRGQDFADNALFKYYWEMNEYFSEKFYEGKKSFGGFGVEGTVTSAILIRGQDFLCDIYDEPEKSKEFLFLLTESIIDYIKFLRRINGEPEIAKSGGIADDFGSLISPDMWDEFVIPYWNQEYEGTTIKDGYRSMHIENLVPAHLKHLSKVKLNYYQPSVSDALTLENVKANLDPDITIDWLLYSYHIMFMTEKEIEDWIDKTVHAGIKGIRTQIDAGTCKFNKLDKIFDYFKGFEKYGV